MRRIHLGRLRFVQRGFWKVSLGFLFAACTHKKESKVSLEADFIF